MRAQALEERRTHLDQRAQNLVQSRNKVDKLAQEYAAATGEAEMAEAKAVRQGEEAEAFRRIADEKRLLAYQLADKWTGMPASVCLLLFAVPLGDLTGFLGDMGAHSVIWQ